MDRAPPLEPTSSPPTLEEIELVFSALAHESRRHIILLLSHAGGELHSGYLAARFQHSWPTTTRHLSVLENAGLVHVRRGGRSSQYRLNRERLQRVLQGWVDHLTPVGPERTWAPTGPRSLGELAAATASKQPKRQIERPYDRTKNRKKKEQ